MKKIISLVCVICLLLSLVIPSSAFGNEEIQEEWQDITLTEEEFNEILSNNPNNEISTYATGLIVSYSIGVSKNGSALVIAGQTFGTTEVKKCGFSVLTIQRRTGSGDTWKNYLTYKDLYNDAGIYALAKTLNLPTGFQYRVTCTHYAKKNIFSVQKIDNISNTITL